MVKILTWGGLAIAAVFFIVGFLAGATNGPDMKPIWPAVYGTNQVLWAGLTLLGLILFVAGLIITIGRAIKNRKQA